MERNKVYVGGFLGGPVVKNQPCSAKDTSSIPWPGKILTLRSNQAHGAQLLTRGCCSRWDAGTPGACALQQGRPPQRSFLRIKQKKQLHSLQLEKAHMQLEKTIAK